MHYTCKYQSPLGEITIAADDECIIGLWFVGQRYYEASVDKQNERRKTPLLKEAERWLDIYFDGREPDFELPLKLKGTDFQKEVWEILLTIPYGCTMTYGEIANIIANRRGIKTMSAQAVGGAVGRNPISIIVPCHRVIGSDGSMTGYAGGIDKKIALLKIENGLSQLKVDGN